MLFRSFVEGALFHLGDGHAWQADGEILGTGIEISMDVTITLEVIKGKEIGWPRGENDEYIFTAGNARPLDQATQHASSEMLRWLQADYGRDEEEAKDRKRTRLNSSNVGLSDAVCGGQKTKQ